MNVNTRIHDRKMSKLAKEKEDREAVLGRALKAAKLPLNTGPQAQISALETYIEKLRLLKVELSDDYDPEEAGDALKWIDYEINKAIELIVHLRIDLIKPER